MNTAQDYLNTLEGFPENQSLMDRDNLCMLLEGYWDWRNGKEKIVWDKLEEWRNQSSTPDFICNEIDELLKK